MRISRVVVVLALVACAGLACSTPANAGDPEVHEDTDYRFQIRRPGKDWTLLPEREARAIAWDAIAGMRGAEGTVLLVTVEEVGERNLDALVTLLREDVAFAPPAERGEVETLTFQGLPARRWTSRVPAATGRSQVVEHLVTLRGAFVFHLAAHARRPEGADSAALRALFHQFTFLEGPVRPRSSSQPIGLRDGVGWRIRGSTFQDAAHGLACTPPTGWRLVVGDELDATSSSACLGLVCDDPNVIVVVISEAVRGAHPAAVLDALRPNQTLGAPEGPVTPLQVGGRTFSMQGYRMATQIPARLYHGVRIDDGRAVQIQWWSSDAVVERARPRVTAAVQSLRFLDPAQVKTLAAELGAARDPQDDVGPSHALRGGVYRDFEHGFTWTKPAGFWSVLAGAAAGAAHEGAVLHLHSAALGLQGTLHVQNNVLGPAQAIHDLEVKRAFPQRPVPKTTTVELPGATALSTEVRTGTPELPRRRVVTTVLKGTRAYVLQVSGFEGNLLTARPQVADVIRGFAFPERLVASETQEGAYVDHRLGFRLKRPPGAGWTLRSNGPPDLEPVGTLMSYEKEDAVVMGGGAFSPSGDAGPQATQELVAGMLRRRAAEAGVGVLERQTTLGGLPAQQLEVGGPLPAILWMARRERIVYMLLIGDPWMLELPRNELSGLLELLD